METWRLNLSDVEMAKIIVGSGGLEIISAVEAIHEAKLTLASMGTATLESIIEVIAHAEADEAKTGFTRH